MEAQNVSESFSWLWEIWHQTPDKALVTDMCVALFLGFFFGYERSYHGRAAGMRTYGLVCMVAAVLTSVSTHPHFWLGGDSTINGAIVDPTRTIQGIVTGIGFLGAGIIMKDGFRISGLTTAASIWASSSIGVLVGLEFYAAAVYMTLIAEAFVLLGSRFDLFLPSRRPIYVSLEVSKEVHPHEEMVRNVVNANGYEIARNSVTIDGTEESMEWRFVAVAKNRRKNPGLSKLADAITALDGVLSFHLSRARN